MGKIPDELRATIARNIRNCRQKMFPGRGGQKKCAAAFSLHVEKNVSPQQWSPWERGLRTPDEVRLEQMAKFFGVTVEFLRKDHRQPISRPGAVAGAPPLLRENEGELPSLLPDPPGSSASFYWLARHFADSVMKNGLQIRFDRDWVEFILSALPKKNADS